MIRSDARQRTTPWIAANRLTRRVAGEPFLARLQELLRPTVVQVLIDPFLAAQLSNAVLAAQAFQHDADLLFSGMMPACGSANIPDCLFSALRYALARLSHRCSLTGYDEPAILSDAISSFCPTSADGLQPVAETRRSEQPWKDWARTKCPSITSM